MTTKLTLTIEQDVIKTAKTYAHKNGRSLSELIENYLKTLVNKEKDSKEISLKVKRLIGSVKLPIKKPLRKKLSKNTANEKFIFGHKCNY
jgi:metal-responsive CopG/Arc/MetJ family transcriptional regulator